MEINESEKSMGWRKRQMVESQLDNDVAYTGKHIGKEIAHRIDPPEPTRNEVLEEVAKTVYDFKAFEKDTMDSFATYIRSMKR